MGTDGLDLASFRLATDTAALVLIWLVQLVIYPAFGYMSVTDFQTWHPVYTSRVTLVVMPIMLSQLGLYAYLALQHPAWAVWLGLAFILAAWAVTFFWAIPLHSALDGGGDHHALAKKLVSVNWWRTALWSIVWGISLLVSFGIVAEQGNG